MARHVSFSSACVLIAIVLAIVALCSTATAKPTSRFDKNGLRIGKGRAAFTTNPTSTFCSAFTAQCYRAAIEGKQSDVRIVYACNRNGKKHSQSFSFGCRADGIDITQAVLNRIGNGYTVTTTEGSTIVETNTLTRTTTQTSSTTQEVDTTTTTGVTVATTTTSTYPVTAQAPTPQVTTTITTATTVTTLVGTTTQYVLGTDAVPLVIVAIPANRGSRRRDDHVDPSSFCSAFSAGCASECARVKSSPKHTICQAGTQTSSTLQYTLACYCRNRKTETQHALKAALNQQHVATVSTLSTSTTFATVTSTTVVPTTIRSTSLFTVTSTSTRTSVVSTPTTVTTTTPPPTAVATTSTTRTSTVSVTSTTEIAVPTIGFLQGFTLDGTSLGYVPTSPTKGPYYTLSTSKASARSFIPVRDPGGANAYQLRFADGSGNVVLVEVALPNQITFGKGQTAFGYFETGLASKCDAAGNGAAPASGAAAFTSRCETYIFGPQADADTISGPYLGTLNMTAQWVNPGPTAPQQQIWSLSADVDYLFMNGDTEEFSKRFAAVTPIYYRFPAS